MRIRTVLAGAVLALALPAAVHAQTVASIGPRAGLSISPDQFTFGGQLDVRGFAPDFSFNPNIELGFGDNLTIIAMNIDGQYHLALQNSNVSPYVGFGIGINFIEADVPSGFPNVDTSTTEVGANIIGGLSFPMQNSNTLFTELRFGVGDIPDFKVMAGWGFPL